MWFLTTSKKIKLSFLLIIPLCIFMLFYFTDILLFLSGMVLSNEVSEKFLSEGISSDIFLKSPNDLLKVINFS